MGNCHKKNKVEKDSASEIISCGSQLDMVNALKDQGSYKVILLGIYVDTKLIIFMRGSREWMKVRTPPPPENQKNIGFFSNTGPDPLKNHKATKPAFNVGPLSARQRNAI